MLQLNNIKLRAPEPRDVDFLFDLENDQSLWPLSNTLTPFSRFDIEQFILQPEKDIFVTRQSRFMIQKITDHEEKLIGAIDLFDIDAQHKRAGVGLVIIEEERNKGYAETSLELIIEYAFDYLELHQLYCNIEETNAKSLSLFLKKGFIQSGIKKEWNRRNKNWVDEYLLQLINRK